VSPGVLGGIAHILNRWPRCGLMRWEGERGWGILEVACGLDERILWWAWHPAHVTHLNLATLGPAIPIVSSH
jgi:hypothetical protein